MSGDNKTKVTGQVKEYADCRVQNLLKRQTGYETGMIDSNWVCDWIYWNKARKMSDKRGRDHIYLGMTVRIHGGRHHANDNICKKHERSSVRHWEGGKSCHYSSIFIDPNASEFSYDRSERFKSVVGKWLWLCKCGRPDVDLLLPSCALVWLRVR